MTGHTTNAQTPIGPFVEGLIGAVALGELASSAAAGVSGVVPLAIGMGIAAAVFAISGDLLRIVGKPFYWILGIVAFVPTAVAFLRGGGCGPSAPTPLRYAMVVLLVLVAGVMFAASLLSVNKRSHGPIGLALFGALQILVSASILIAGSGSSTENLALGSLVVAAAMLGWLVVRYTDAVLGIAAAVTGMQSIYAAATPLCGSPNYSGAVLIIVFIGAYFATRALASPFSGRR